MSDMNRDSGEARWGRPQRRRSRGVKTASTPSEPGFVGPVDDERLADGAPTIVRAQPVSTGAAPPMTRGEPDDVDSRLRDLVAHLARGIVDHGQDVQVEILRSGDEASFELRVHPDDLGHVIGKQGRTARSLRLVLGAAAERSGRKAGLEIAD